MTKTQYEVRYAYDDESKNWSFRVPELNIVGGGDTREEAEKMARQAIDFTLNDGSGSRKAGWLIAAGALGAVAFGAARIIGSSIKRTAGIR